MKNLLCAFAALMLVSACVPQAEQTRMTRRGSLPESPPLMAPESKNAVEAKGVIPPGVPSVKVALLLPLSGESVSIGNAMLDAANMAVYDHYLATPSSRIKSQVILLPKDTGNTPAEAARATQAALDQGATFIVGPLFSQSVKSAAPLAHERGVTMLTFSNNKSVAATDVFTFGFLPEQQILRVAEYAFLRNYQRVALLAPNDAYGQKIQESLKEIYAQKGGVVQPTELYAPSPTNIDAAVARLAAFNNANADRKFQAIFVADSGYQLKNIITSIKKTNIDLKEVKLLGTGLWDDPEIAKIPEMNGAWFSSSQPEAYRDFERRFVTIYGYKPVRLASLAFDAVSIIINITMPQPAANVDIGALTNKDGFLGLSNGLVRLSPDGTAERKLAIMEVTPEGFKVLEAASPSFDSPGIMKMTFPINPGMPPSHP